jgi:hypothetical protein
MWLLAISSFEAIYPTNKGNKAIAKQYGDEFRRVFREVSDGKPPNAYVNYAVEDETWRCCTDINRGDCKTSRH